MQVLRWLAAQRHHCLHTTPPRHHIGPQLPRCSASNGILEGLPKGSTFWAMTLSRHSNRCGLYLLCMIRPKMPGYLHAEDHLDGQHRPDRLPHPWTATKAVYTVWFHPAARGCRYRCTTMCDACEFRSAHLPTNHPIRPNARISVKVHLHSTAHWTRVPGSSSFEDLAMQG